MINGPDISVVMCCYNAEKYINNTINSVLAQTFSNFEFIIWNDGSTDDTKTIIENYHDSRIRLFNDINRGEGKAAQLACEHVRSRYISRIDADDIWMEDKLKLEFEYMESHPDIVLVSCPYIKIDEDGKVLGRSFPVRDANYLSSSINRENRFIHSGALYRTESYKKSGGYCDIRLFQDTLLFRRLSDYGKLSLMPIPLIKYRILSNSVSHRIHNSPYARIIEELKRKIVRDKGYVEQDIYIFNLLYAQIGKSQSEDHIIYKPSFSDRVYDFLDLFLNEEISYRVTSYLYNVFVVVKKYLSRSVYESS